MIRIRRTIEAGLVLARSELSTMLMPTKTRRPLSCRAPLWARTVVLISVMPHLPIMVLKHFPMFSG